MAEILTNKENLLKYGYCVVRNLLSNKEVKRAESVLDNIYKKNEKKISLDMYKYSESWNFLLVIAYWISLGICLDQKFIICIPVAQKEKMKVILYIHGTEIIPADYLVKDQIGTKTNLTMY